MADSHQDDGSTATLDIDAAVERISAQLGEQYTGELEEPTETPGMGKVEATQPEPPPQAQPEPTPAPTVYDVPKSWKKDMHPHWTKLDPSVQGYVIEREKQLLDGFSTVRPIQDVLNPHLDFLKQMNIEPHRAIDALLRAQRRLTEGSIEDRRAAYQELGRNLRLIEEAAAAQQDQTPIDPALQAIQHKVATLEQAINAEREAQIEAIRAENRKKIDEFAADTKAHPYFEEVADDIALFVKHGLSLQEAYEKAVWVNPVTRAKEQARALTEHEAKLKENARLAALPKRKAAAVNIKSGGDGPEPTEPLGSIEDTIRSTAKAIRARAS